MRRRSLLGFSAAAAARVCVAGMAFAGFVLPAQAQPDLSQKVGPSVADMPSDSHRFERFELPSADGLRHYRVQLAVPRSAQPAAGFPVLYLLDGNAAFAALTQAQLASMAQQEAPLVIAAIGYATDLRFDVAARTYDYLPALPNTTDAPDAPAVPPARQSGVATGPASGRSCGGADLFLDLIETRIKPAVQSRAAIDLARQSLWGHSYGGLFVLHTLIRRPSAFDTYIAADPSLWWADGFFQRNIQPAPTAPVTAFAAAPTTAPADGVRLLVMTGSGASAARVHNERRSAPPDAALRLVERQSRRPGVKARLREFAGVSHGQMLALSLGPAIDLASSVGPP